MVLYRRSRSRDEIMISDITLKNLSGSAKIEYQIVRTAAYESICTPLGHRRSENGVVARVVVLLKKVSYGKIHEAD